VAGACASRGEIVSAMRALLHAPATRPPTADETVLIGRRVEGVMRRAGPALALAGVFGALAHALNIAFGMTWEILLAPSSASPNIAFLLLTAVLVVRFLRTGGPAMLRMMGNPPGELASPAVARNTHAWAHLEAGTQDTSARCSQRSSATHWAVARSAAWSLSRERRGRIGSALKQRRRPQRTSPNGAEGSFHVS
jgi:hypothetical protein